MWAIDILDELAAVGLKISVIWVSLPVCGEIVKELYVSNELNTRAIAEKLIISKSTALDRCGLLTSSFEGGVAKTCYYLNNFRGFNGTTGLSF